MDTTRYRRLVLAFHEQIAAYDANSSRVTSKWLSTLDDLVSSVSARKLLMEHMIRVARSAQAITIVAQERASHEPELGAEEILDATLSDLTSEIVRLQKECRRLEGVLNDRGLDMIVGEFMDSVSFVMDYINLSFCGGVLTTHTYPEVTLESGILRLADSGYRDALCALIGAKVESVDLRPGEVLRILFQDQRAISISMRPDDAVGPEYVEFTSASGLCWSW